MRDCPVCHDKSDARKRKSLAGIGDVTMADFDWSSYPADAEGLSEKERLIRDFCDGFTEYEKESFGLFIYGATAGSGKTFLAKAIAGTVLETWSEGSARMVTEADILQLSKQRTEDGSDPLMHLMSCRLLIVDDLGQKKKGRDWLDDVLFRIIDYRNQNRRITLYTSNYDLKHLPDGGRIADRINEHVIPVHMPDVSIRARQAAEKKAAFLRRRGIT